MRQSLITQLRRERTKLVKQTVTIQALLDRNAGGHCTSADIAYIRLKIARVDAQIAVAEARVSA